MSKHFFDYDDGDFVFSISDNTAMDSDGDLLIRMSDKRESIINVKICI